MDRCKHSAIAEHLLAEVEVLEPVDKTALISAIKKSQIELRKKTKHGRRLIIEDIHAENLSYSWLAIEELTGQVFEDTTHLIVAFRRARGRCVHRDNMSIPRTDAMHLANSDSVNVAEERTGSEPNLDIDRLPLSEEARFVMTFCEWYYENHGKAPSKVAISAVTDIERTRKLPRVLEEIQKYLSQTCTESTDIYPL